MSARILVVDDKPNMRKLIASTLEDLGEVVVADGGLRALELLSTHRFHVVVSDIKMPDADGHAVLRAARKLERPPEVILITGFASVDSAIDAVREGAFDYVKKPFDPDDLKAAVQRALARAPSFASAVDAASTSWSGLVGRTAAMLDLFRLLERAATTEATVLILGESGTGKELVAQAIHARSPRASRPFVAVNCAAIPAALMEAELFGHARGAFTGAVANRPGLFEEANTGTLFLDEIGEMRRALQAKLTRALEARAVRRVGEANERPVDVRVIAATHRDLPNLVAQEAFREDLFYRLNTCIVRVPPLRERADDIPLLTEFFLAQRGGKRRVSGEAMQVLRAHAWPGNVRELRSALERAAIVSEGEVITRADLPPEISKISPGPIETPIDLLGLTYRDAVERMRSDSVKRYLEMLLEHHRGSVVAAAEHADLERESFYRLCRKHGVNPTEFRGPPKSRP